MTTDASDRYLRDGLRYRARAEAQLAIAIEALERAWQFLDALCAPHGWRDEHVDFRRRTDELLANALQLAREVREVEKP